MDLKKNLITLTTDFGGRDYFVGSMKGVILGINPEANIIDVSHDVVSHDIWGATYLLASAYRYFPPYTIHIVVVDPGVGSQRRPVLAVTDKHYFIAPDNGVLSFIYDDPGFSRVINITADHYFLPVSGSTFHARDIFAPCAAWLSKGVEADKLGEEITDYVKFNMPSCRAESDGTLSGEVVYVDKFGNSITNISFDDIRAFVERTGRQSYTVVLKDRKFASLAQFYAAVPKGEAGVVVNGNGKLEVFVNQGDARKTLGLRRGEKVSILFE